MLLRVNLAFWQAVFFSSAVVCGILTELFPAGWLAILRGSMALIALLAALPSSTRQSRAAALSLMLAGTLLFYSRRVAPATLLQGFGEMLPVVSLLACASTMGIPLRLGNYGLIFEVFLRRRRNRSTRLFICGLTAYLLAVLALFGSVPISYHILARAVGGLPRSERDYLVATAITRGYAMAIIWSPVAANVGIALSYAHLSWTSFAPSALLLSIVGLIFGTFLSDRKASKNQRVESRSFSEQPVIPLATDIARVSGLACLLGGAVLLIAFFERYLGIGALGSIALGCMVTSAAWGGLTRRMSSVLDEFRLYFFEEIKGLADQILLLVGAGFFATVLGTTGIAGYLGSAVNNLASTFGRETVLLLLPVCVIGLALLGLHPFASAAVLAKSLSPGLVGVPPVSLALALTTGVALAFIISPFAGITLFLAAETGRTSLEIGIKWNSLYVISFLLISVLFNAVISTLY